MRIARYRLPQGVTVIAVPDVESILVDTSLSREQATLAVGGILPEVHPDVVEHWLDAAFTRMVSHTHLRRLSAFGATALLSVSLGAVAHQGQGQRSKAPQNVVAASARHGRTESAQRQTVDAPA